LCFYIVGNWHAEAVEEFEEDKQCIWAHPMFMHGIHVLTSADGSFVLEAFVYVQ